MPRPKKAGAPEPKRRSRNGCWPCKARKVKCGEEKPHCLNCERQGEACDYSIRLNWGGRTKPKTDDSGTESPASATGNSFTFTFPVANDILGTPPPPPVPRSPYDQAARPSSALHARSQSSPSGVFPNHAAIDPQLIDTFRMGENRPPTSQPRGIVPGPINPRLHTVRRRSSFGYPSPSASTLQSPDGNGDGQNIFNGGIGSPPGGNPMLPPFPGSPAASSPATLYPSLDAALSPGHDAKRRRISPAHDSPVTAFKPLPFSQGLPYPANRGPNVNMQSDQYFAVDGSSPSLGPPTPYSLITSGPDTPSNLAPPDEPCRSQRPGSLSAPTEAPPELRRVSVNSLLSDAPSDPESLPRERQYSIKRYPHTNFEEGTTTYGYDMGHNDLDTPKMNDAMAIELFSPPLHRAFPNLASPTEEFGPRHRRAAAMPRPRDIAFEKNGYYENPVPIRIPRSLEPLPAPLLENPMNLLYFHHFLNHTARVLVPHDCEQNPFREILPQIALTDGDLLNLLLAYSASHRARLLGHAEPANRIATWVQNVFPKLRHAVYESHEPISNSTLATAIMLASLEIISPNTFEVPVSWRKHLAIAREMILARGGTQSIHKQDKVSYFLSRWFAYLDVLGSLSGAKNDRPLSSSYWVQDELGGHDEYEIDCMFGFTTRSIGILARVAELAKTCESERLDSNGNFRDDWQPSESMVEAAERLKEELREGRTKVSKGCKHRSTIENENEFGWDSLEIFATNDAYHWAGLIHLNERVLGKHPSDPEVQVAVREIVGALSKIRPGSTAEACLLFPLFAAGCDATDPEQRDTIMGRLTNMEGFGLLHVNKARTLMQKVWETGRPVETLVSDEFFG